MPSIRADAGHASRLDGLPVDLKGLRVQGNGFLRINEDQHPPRMTWSPSPPVGLTFLSQNDDRVDEETLQAILAVVKAYNPGDDSHAGPSEETIPEYASMSRLKFLQDEAVHDGYVLSTASEIDFWQFVRGAPDVRKGNLSRAGRICCTVWSRASWSRSVSRRSRSAVTTCRSRRDRSRPR